MSASLHTGGEAQCVRLAPAESVDRLAFAVSGCCRTPSSDKPPHNKWAWCGEDLTDRGDLASALIPDQGEGVTHRLYAVVWTESPLTCCTRMGCLSSVSDRQTGQAVKPEPQLPPGTRPFGSGAHGDIRAQCGDRQTRCKPGGAGRARAGDPRTPIPTASLTPGPGDLV